MPLLLTRLGKALTPQTRKLIARCLISNTTCANWLRQALEARSAFADAAARLPTCPFSFRLSVELQQLQHFIAAVETKRLITAAQVCGITQSGMSRSLANLQDALGVTLLKRTYGGVEPTEYGRFFLPSARMIVSEVERCSREMRALKEISQNTVRFGVADDFCQLIIPPLLDMKGRGFLDMDIQIQTGNVTKLVDALQSGAVDCVFGLIGALEEHPDFIPDRIVTHQTRVIARRDHPLAREQAAISALGLSSARWATLDDDEFERVFADFFSSRQLPRPSVVMRSDSFGAIVEALSSSDLITFLPPQLIGDAMKNHRLVALECCGPDISLKTTVVTRRIELMVPEQVEVIHWAQRLAANRFCIAPGESILESPGKPL